MMSQVCADNASTKALLWGDWGNSNKSWKNNISTHLHAKTILLFKPISKSLHIYILQCCKQLTSDQLFQQSRCHGSIKNRRSFQFFNVHNGRCRFLETTVKHYISWITSQKFHLGSAVSAQQVAWINQKQSCENKIYAFATLIALQYNFYIITIVAHAH